MYLETDAYNLSIPFNLPYTCLLWSSHSIQAQTHKHLCTTNVFDLFQHLKGDSGFSVCLSSSQSHVKGDGSWGEEWFLEAAGLGSNASPAIYSCRTCTGYCLLPVQCPPQTCCWVCVELNELKMREFRPVRCLVQGLAHRSGPVNTCCFVLQSPVPSAFSWTLPVPSFISLSLLYICPFPFSFFF